MESFEMRILHLVLTELLNTGRIKAGDTLDNNNAIHNAAITMVRALGMGNGGVVSDNRIRIEYTRPHYIVSIDNTPPEEESRYTPIYVPHPVIDADKVNFDFICRRIVESAGHYEHHYRHNTDTLFMQRVMNLQLSVLCGIKKPTLDEPLTLGTEVLLHRMRNEYVIKVSDETYYRTSIDDVEAIGIKKDLSKNIKPHRKVIDPLPHKFVSPDSV